MMVDLLPDGVAKEAHAAGAIDLRLYVHGSNARALDAYRRCGCEETEYILMRRPLAGE